ncbi:MAG: RNB domain-containing ribonuclease [Treponema sp.]|jgi:exoribonuclease-2|nr:RNB domain-containing ribonuclease [Treponema sp.]
MISEKALVAYKNHPALVSGVSGGSGVSGVSGAGEKVSISLLGGDSLRVREKDVEFLHPGPLTTLAGLEADAGNEAADIRGAWELIEGQEVSLKELTELIYGEFSPPNAWAAYQIFRDGLYFFGTIEAIRPRAAADVAQEEQKRAEKRQGEEEREAFLARLKAGTLIPQDGRFLQDVEALAYGKTKKSRTLRELGNSETPEEAHRFLLRNGVWTPLVNPHPARFGLSLISAGIDPGPPPEEERVDLTALRSFAVDNAYSDDPDDAISIEGNILYVHVSDPASAILPDSPADLEARGRGATLYLPEGISRMIAVAALPYYALGQEHRSPALTFKIRLNEDGSIGETEIIPSFVKVTRLTYADADRILSDGGETGPEGADFAALDRLAARNQKRREAAGAAVIELPEVHISLREGEVSFEPDKPYRSANVIRECMLLAGEGAGRWAQERRLPFPYVCQDAGEPLEAVVPGMAGSYQLRRRMKPRELSIKPGRHWGLGMENYTQVTSPLRRYTDLLAHQQIRASLGAGLYRIRHPLEEDALLPAMAAGEAAAGASVHAERASRAHWTAVYLAGKKGSRWDAVVLDKKGNRATVMIPLLGLETQVFPQNDPELNSPIALTLKSVKIPEKETLFVPA